MKYSDRLNTIFATQKKGGDIYYNYFTRYISAPLTALISYTFITPNMATLSMFFFGIVGAIFFSFGGAHNFLWGGIFFVLLIIADTIDGELARFRGTSSLFGDYFDRLAHYTTNPLMILGVGLGIYSEYPETYFLYITYFIMICYLIDDISRDLLISCGLADSDSKGKVKTLCQFIKVQNYRLLCIT